MTNTSAPTVSVTVDHAYRSHDVVDQIRSTWITFDHIGAHFRGDNLALAANLTTLAALATQFATHIVRTEETWDAEDTEVERRLHRHLRPV